MIGILNADPGISPDMRYLSTSYLPIGILGLFVIDTLISKDNKKALAVTLSKYLLIVTPVLLFVLLLIHPFGSSREDYILALALVSYAALLLTIVGAALKINGKIGERTFIILLMLMITIPFAWQMLNLFILSGAKFNGYSYWIPIIQNLHQSFFHKW